LPPRDPSKIQLDFPQLIADVIADLNLVGTVGLLDFAPTVLPVYIIGDRDLTVDSVPVAFRSAEIFSGFNAAAGIAAVIADTGALPAGTYDIFAKINLAGSTAAVAHAEVQHRNAANAATLAVLADVPTTSTVTSGNASILHSGYVLAGSERIRIQMLVAALSGGITGVIGARLRPVP